eukprot:TRINITY_DN78115_c0_g1_i1.p1 TRINITY_DN78115_c0_g1~~TRINITY_DN78115_c0_g1_i1.p1  ORF type:complete len:563 (+),score=115.64 TRINITY_DN78115_c0_g1_i1:96-1784(+)
MRRSTGNMGSSPKLPLLSRTGATPEFETKGMGRSDSKGRIQALGQLTIQVNRPASRSGLCSPHDLSPKSSKSVSSLRADFAAFGMANGGSSRNRGLSAATTTDSPTAHNASSSSGLSVVTDDRGMTHGYLSPPKSPSSPQSAAFLLAKSMQNTFPPGSSRPSSRSGSRPGTPSAQGGSLQAAGLVLARPASRGDCEPFGFGEEEPRLKFKSRLLQRRGKSSSSLNVDVSAPGSRPGAGPAKQFEMTKEIRMLEESEKIFDLYHWNEVLQEEGDGGKVVVCEPKSDYSAVPSKKYVMKMRSKKSLIRDEMEEQFRKSLLRLLNLPGHEGVLPLQEALEDDNFYYIVMEQATGGSFFGGLLKEYKDGIMPPREVRRLMMNILEAVGHVHACGMLHRDIKPDNLVMRLCDDCSSPTGKSRRVAIIDFDHADSDWRLTAEDKDNQEFCGTVYFSAPEAFIGQYSQASDLYSVGIIMYLLLAGKMPFDQSLFDQEMPMGMATKGWSKNVYKRMKSTDIDWECDPWTAQPVCCDFCKWLLAFDPSKRPATADQALAHLLFEDMSPTSP